MRSLQSWTVIGAYGVGLGIAEWLALYHEPVQSIYGGLGLLGLSLILAFTVPRRWRTGPNRNTWIVAGLIALLAASWWAWRFPKVGENDISHHIQAKNASDAAIEQVITGWVDSPAQITRGDRIRFTLKTEEIQNQGENGQLLGAAATVTGKVYVTLPQDTADTAQESETAKQDIHPGQKVQITGKLYEPKPADYPGAFDFRAYLKRQGIFAGISLYSTKSFNCLDNCLPSDPPDWGMMRFRYELANVRSHIVNSLITGLGSPNGELVGGMVLGRQAANVPYDLQDAFMKAGLAHTLAASGFHVSLLLSVVIWATRGLGAKTRLGIGLGVLTFYVGLTGIQPSVMRAALMGVGGLIGMVMERRVKQYAALAGVVFLLLLFNPLWTGNVGFWLSVLATLGLVVTVQPLTKALDWLPPTIAALVSVPIAAFLWTLPLALFTFGVISPYSIILNILTTPLIIVITLGGIVTIPIGLTLTAVGWTDFYQFIASWSLSKIVEALIFLVNICNSLPGSSYAVGKILLPQMLLIYGLIFLSWLQPWWQKRRWMASALALAMVAVPIGYARAATVELTVLDADFPTVILRDRTQTHLITDGNEKTVRHGILPMLQQDGVNRIAAAIAPTVKADESEGWKSLQAKTPMNQLFSVHAFESVPNLTIQPLPTSQTNQTGQIQTQVIYSDPSIIQVKFQDQTWLIAEYFGQEMQDSLRQTKALQDVDVLLWYGGFIQDQVLTQIKPEVAIAFGRLKPDIEKELEDRDITVFWTQRDGAIQWTPERQFVALAEGGIGE